MRSLCRFVAAIFIIGSFSISPSFAADDVSSWKTAVVKKVSKKQRYPRAAATREIEGKARIRLTVLADGTISNHEVIEATGEDVLDREIPKLVKRLNPLPALPGNRTELSFVLPLDWSLN
jgi:protein TonB